MWNICEEGWCTEQTTILSSVLASCVMVCSREKALLLSRPEVGSWRREGEGASRTTTSHSAHIQEQQGRVSQQLTANIGSFLLA